MIFAPPVSVVVVSRDRPEDLARCVTGLTQLAYPEFEIVIVADKPGLLRLDRMPAVFERTKRVRFDSANISHARNLGIAQAAGEIIAFIDDDAVPEPLWLRHLVGPFSDARVQSVGGAVLGRNGVALQWGPRCILPTGRCEAIDTPGMEPAIFAGRPGLGIKTEGTNMAFRRTTLAAIGGFDPAFWFYLDESDLNLRLAGLGHGAALVPLAQVHHGFLESPRRRADRVPLDLTEIGASLVVFLKKHADSGEHEFAIHQEREDRRRALLRHMVAGRIEPGDVQAILSTFDTGLEVGRFRKIEPLPTLPAPVARFRRFVWEDRPPGRHQVVSGRVWQRAKVKAQAASLALEGGSVTAFVLSPTMRPHKVSFTKSGYWLHRGGLFGKSLRDDPMFQLWRFKSRLNHEMSRLAAVRGGGAAPR